METDTENILSETLALQNKIRETVETKIKYG